MKAFVPQDLVSNFSVIKRPQRHYLPNIVHIEHRQFTSPEITTMLKEVTPDFFAKKLLVVERLPKKMTSPFWLFNRALINNGIKQVD
jgi:hypothetical protein